MCGRLRGERGVGVTKWGETMINGLIPEQVRLIWTLLTSTLLAIVAPTGAFVGALTLASMFYVWAGMRADRVCVISC